MRYKAKSIDKNRARRVVESLLEDSQPQPTATDILHGAFTDPPHPESTFHEGDSAKVMKLVSGRDQNYLGVFGRVIEVKHTGEYNPDEPTVKLKFQEYVTNRDGKEVDEDWFFPEELARVIAKH